MMIQRFVVVLLVMFVVLVGLVRAEDAKKVVVASAKELKGIKAKKIIWKKDGSEMALIPAGSFEMGDSMNEPEGWMDRSRPVHRVELDAFYMDVNEVTVGQFKQFVEESGYAYHQFLRISTTGTNRWQDVAMNSPGDDYPMVYVSWHDAVAYCEWAGKRLPTEAEWEYAARGGLVGKRYPWGDEITHDDANYGGTGGSDKWDKCALVGSFESNGYGLYDMAGNVWEWCADWYDENYYSISPLKNPKGPDTGAWGVLRGGSWNFNPGDLRAAVRHFYNPALTFNGNGFRCVSGFPAAQQ